MGCKAFKIPTNVFDIYNDIVCLLRYVLALRYLFCRRVLSLEPVARRRLMVVSTDAPLRLASRLERRVLIVLAGFRFS